MKEKGNRRSERELEDLERRIVACRLCPRLVEHRERVGRVKVRRFADQRYWGKPLPAFGDPRARLLIVGLAPAAHGGNRTGRMFTGDRSGDWLYEALHRFGFANRSESVHREDELKLKDCWITAAARCPPPRNKPTAREVRNCRPYLVLELEPDAFVDYNNLARLEMQSNDFKAAADLYEAAVDINPRNIEGYIGLREAAHLTGDEKRLERAESMLKVLKAR